MTNAFAKAVDMGMTNRSDNVRKVIWRSLVWYTCALMAAPAFSIGVAAPGGPAVCLA
jgi:hypothetical protein